MVDFASISFIAISFLSLLGATISIIVAVKNKEDLQTMHAWSVLAIAFLLFAFFFRSAIPF